MNLSRIALFAGVGALALAGIARAELPETHVLNVRLPSGQMEQIRYRGDVAPVVAVMPGYGPAAAMAADPFAMLREVSAVMDAQAAAMMQAMAMPQTAFPSGFGPVTVAAGPGVCMRSVQITYRGNGAAPHVVSRTAGDCGAAGHSTSSVAIPESPVPAKPPVKTYQVKYDVPAPYQTLIHPVNSLSR